MVKERVRQQEFTAIITVWVPIESAPKHRKQNQQNKKEEQAKSTIMVNTIKLLTDNNETKKKN